MLVPSAAVAQPVERTQRREHVVEMDEDAGRQTRQNLEEQPIDVVAFDTCVESTNRTSPACSVEDPRSTSCSSPQST